MIVSRCGALLLLVGCAFAPGDRAGSPGRDVGEPVLEFAWKRTIHDRTWDSLPQEFATPVVSDGVIFAGAQGGTFYALRETDGSVIWEHDVGPVSSEPLVLGENVLVGTDEGVLWALGRGNGQVVWRYTTQGAILHAPIVVSDLVVFANSADHLYALDRHTGKWRWQYEREVPEEFTLRGHAGVALAGDRVFAGFSDGHVVALTAGGGEVIWVRSLAGASKEFVDVDSVPAIEGETMYVASGTGGLYALDISDGTERWHFDVKGAGGVALGDNRVYAAAADQGIFALDERGHVLWRQGLRGAGDPSRPLAHGSRLFLSVSEKGLLVIDQASGALLQSFEPGSGISATPVIADDRVHVLSNGGILYSFLLGTS